MDVLLHCASADGERIVPEAEGDDIVGVLLRGIEKSDIRRGMGIETLARPFPPATGTCKRLSPTNSD